MREGAAPAYSGREARGERRGSLLGRLRNRREPPNDAAAEDEPAAPSRLRRPVELPRRRPSEPRHVRAVPTGTEQRMAAAVDAFNGSEHPRTVAGVARSLGAPGVAVLPDEQRPSQVIVTVWWELSWYRYEVDLGDGSVRVGSQGSELNELSEPELAPNARCDERGMLSLDD